jgi:hypothetical protein
MSSKVAGESGDLQTTRISGCHVPLAANADAERMQTQIRSQARSKSEQRSS